MAFKVARNEGTSICNLELLPLKVIVKSWKVKFE